jgi:hypothetical protein
MNSPSAVHSNSASAEITIPRGEINNSLNYAAGLIVEHAEVDVTERVLKGLKFEGRPTDQFDGLGQGFQGDLKSVVVAGGETALSLTLFRRDPDDIYVFSSIPEGGMDTASTTFLQYRGPQRDLVKQHTAAEIAGLLDDLFSTEKHGKNVLRNAERPFSYFVETVMKEAWRYSSTDSTERTYYADYTELDSPRFQAATDKLALARGINPLDMPTYIVNTEARLSVRRVKAETPVIKNSLLAPTTITRDIYPFVQPTPDNFLTLNTEFRAQTLMTSLRQFRAGLMKSATSAEMHVENPGAPLPRPEDLYDLAKYLASRAEPMQYIARSLKILAEGKGLPLTDLT